MGIKNKATFVGGCSDPEQWEIARVVSDEVGPEYRYVSALNANGQPVRNGEAYRVPASGLPEGIGELVVVEAAVVEVSDDGSLVEVEPDVIADHHFPRNPQYYYGPDKATKASSLYQVLGYLDMEPTHRQDVMSAVDHSLYDALRGNIEGISPDEALAQRTLDIAASFPHLSPEQVRDNIADLEHILEQEQHQLGRITIGNEDVVDLRGQNLGAGYSLEYLEAQTALVHMGWPALVTMRDMPDGPEMVFLTGAQPSTVEAFQSAWAEEQGLKGIFGVPRRHYAGGYAASSDVAA